MIEREIEQTKDAMAETEALLARSRVDKMHMVSNPDFVDDGYSQGHAITGFNTEGDRRSLSDREKDARRKRRKAASRSRKRNR